MRQSLNNLNASGSERNSLTHVQTVHCSNLDTFCFSTENLTIKPMHSSHALDPIPVRSVNTCPNIRFPANIKVLCIVEACRVYRGRVHACETELQSAIHFARSNILLNNDKMYFLDIVYKKVRNLIHKMNSSLRYFIKFSVFSLYCTSSNSTVCKLA